MMLILLTTLFNPGIIPGYLVVKDMGLMNSIWSLIIPVLTSGWYVLLMKGFFDSIPASLEEAARIDGCNDLTVWIRIILPLSLPSIAAFDLFYAVAYWNTFFNAVTSMGADALSDSGMQSIPAQTKKMAAVIISTVPILLMYPFLQKHFAKGAMVGSVKE